MALLKEYSTQSKGLKTPDDFYSFSFEYFKFFAQFRIHYEGTFCFVDRIRDFESHHLSTKLNLRCRHDSPICDSCLKRPDCKVTYCPCPKCYKTFSQRGIVALGHKEEVILELLDFAYGQMAWIVKFKTQNQIRHNSSKMKDECQRRVNFFMNKLEEKKYDFLPGSISYSEEKRLFELIRDRKDYFGF